MSRPQQSSAPDASQVTEVYFDAGVREVLDRESRPARRHAAELRGERNAILDAVAVIVTDVIRRHGFAVLAPVVARFRTTENGNTGVEVAVRLEDPNHASAAKAAIVERFPDHLSEVIVS